MAVLQRTTPHPKIRDLPPGHQATKLVIQRRHRTLEDLRLWIFIDSKCQYSPCQLPELLLESKFYSCEVDVWSCGCVFGELLKGGIFLAGRSATNQAEIVFDALGTPTKDELNAMQASNTKYQKIKEGYEPDPTRKTFNFSFMYHQTVNSLKDRKTFVYNNKINLRDMRESIDLIRQILVYSPERRLSGIDLLTNVYFNELFSGNSI